MLQFLDEVFRPRLGDARLHSLAIDLVKDHRVGAGLGTAIPLDAPLLALDAGPFLVGPCHDVLNTAAHDAILGPQVHGSQAVEVTGAVLSEIKAGIDLFHASATDDMTQMLPEVDAVGMLSRRAAAPL